MIEHSDVELTKQEISPAIDVLRSGMLVQGKHVASLEKSAATLIGVKYGAVVSSGTSALHLAMLSLGLGPGCQVIIPSYVCSSPLNAVHYAGASPVFVDIDPNTYNIDAEEVRKALTDKTRAIIVPHMFGLPADIESIVSFGVPVIEDCAHSIGAKFRGRYAGVFGTLCVLSFYATKMVGAGEGGAVLSGNPDLIETVRDLRAYDKKPEYRVRYNYKMTDFQAALAESRLKRLPFFIQRRKEIAGIYNKVLSDFAKRLPLVPEEGDHAYYRYIIRVKDSDLFIEQMLERGIECKKPVFRPLHRYLNLGGYPETDLAWEQSVSLPMYPSLSNKQAYIVADETKKILDSEGGLSC